jgi:hypothetical protein
MNAVMPAMTPIVIQALLGTEAIAPPTNTTPNRIPLPAALPDFFLAIYYLP